MLRQTLKCMKRVLRRLGLTTADNVIDVKVRRNTPHNLFYQQTEPVVVLSDKLLSFLCVCSFFLFF